MKHIFAIAMKDIQQCLREKQTFMFLLIMPILFTVLFGFAFGGLGGGGSKETRVPVAFVDNDQSAASQGLRSILENQNAINVEARNDSMAALEDQVAKGKLAAVIAAPAGYGQSMEAGTPLQIEVIVDATSVNGAKAQSAIQAAVLRTASAAAAARIAIKGKPEGFNEAFEAACAAWIDSPVRLQVEQAAQKSQTTSILPLTHTAPAMMIQFAMAGLLTAAQVLVHERKTRCMQRLLTTRAARHEILLGHFLSIFAVIFVQFVLLVGFGQLLMGLDYLRLPAATLVMMLTAALFVSALGLLIGSLARSDEQATIFALAPMFVLSGLGGAWLPLNMAGGTFRAIGQVTPVAFALEGFENVIARGLDFNSVLLPALALLGYAVVFFGLAAWRFKFE